mmetsp:Transcript_16093/g.40948  ORF Transcript_16093/g.40948 Transcript_16093/m.40948 type:complete len:382 (+) Transcript_16093:98-1243(+)
MGCGGSKTTANQVSQNRRRLSVGHVDDTGGSAGQDTEDEVRGLVKELDAASLMAMLKDGETQGRRFSIGSITDQGKQQFANKKTTQDGDKVDPVSYGLGYTCRKGLKPESPNQDSWMVLKVESDVSIYGVFDGHGKQGHDISNYVKDTLPKLILKDERFKTKHMKEMLMDSFKKVQQLVAAQDRAKKFNAQMSGTTATLVVHDHTQGKLTIAHVADSTCVLGSVKDAESGEGKALTRDHKPNLSEERARIEKAGGRVVFDGYANHRVYAKNGRYPGLNMSRCLGDLMGHADAGCSCEPEVSVHEIQPKDKILLLCSDGVWEFIKPQDAINLVWQREPHEAMATAETLAKAAWDRWIQEEGGAVVDDITVVLVYLQQASKVP